MSHIAAIACEVTSLDALEKACDELGLKLIRDKKTYKWYGASYSAQRNLPTGFTEADLGKCEHTISVVGNSKAYEIGVVSRRDGQPGYHLLWDNWMGGEGLVAKVGKDAGLLSMHVGVEQGLEALRRKGFRVNKKRLASGNYVVEGVK